MTLIEVVIALTVLSVGILGLLVSISSSLIATDANREEAIAMNCARAKLSELQLLTLNGNFSTIFSTYNSTQTAHSVNVATMFSNPTAENNLSDPNASCTVLFPEGGAGGTLVEGSSPSDIFFGLTAAQANNMGMPQDIDGNGTLDGITTDKAGTYSILPVCINVSWVSINGNRSVNLYAVLARLK